MRRRESVGNMSRMDQARRHSVLGMVGGRLFLRLGCHKDLAFGATSSRRCCCEGRDPQGEVLRAPQHLCPP